MVQMLTEDPKTINKDPAEGPRSRLASLCIPFRAIFGLFIFLCSGRFKLQHIPETIRRILFLDHRLETVRSSTTVFAFYPKKTYPAVGHNGSKFHRWPPLSCFARSISETATQAFRLGMAVGIINKKTEKKDGEHEL